MQTDNAMMKRIERPALIYLAHISQLPHEVRWTLVQHQRFAAAEPTITSRKLTEVTSRK
jgi:hypothetical protein